MRIKTLKLVRWRSKPKIMLLPKNTINIVLFPQWIDQCIILRRQEKSNFLFIHIYIFFAKHDNPDIVLMDNLTKFNFLGPDEQGYVFIICHNTGIIWRFLSNWILKANTVNIFIHNWLCQKRVIFQTLHLQSDGHPWNRTRGCSSWAENDSDSTRQLMSLNLSFKSQIKNMTIVNKTLIHIDLRNGWNLVESYARYWLISGHVAMAKSKWGKQLGNCCLLSH